jgi:hypothetical protein
MLRGMVPQHTLIETAKRNIVRSDDNSQERDRMAEWLDKLFSLVAEIYNSTASGAILQVVWERQIGYLHLLEQIVKVMGFSVTNYVNIFVNLLLSMLVSSTQIASTSNDVTHADNDEDDHEAEEENHGLDENEDDDDMAIDTSLIDNQSSKLRDANQSTKVRAMCVRRLAGME